MSIYKDTSMIEELRKFHLHIGRRFDPMADMCVQESVVGKLLRAQVSLVIVRLSSYEQDQWSMALARKEPEFADTQDWTLSGQIPKLLRPHFGPTFDYAKFADFWAKEVPAFTVVDIEREFLPGMETGKTWIEHVVRYLHHVPLFYVEQQ